MSEEIDRIKKIESETASPRAIIFAFIFFVIALIALAVWGYWHFIGSRFVETDNAYAATEVAQITPAITGTVIDVKVKDTEIVKAGDILVVFEDTDQRLALAQAEVNLQLAIRKFNSYKSSDNERFAQIQARSADRLAASSRLRAAQADFEKARIDLSRRQALVGSGAVSQDELTKARDAFENAKASLDTANAVVAQANANQLAATSARATNAAIFQNTSVSNNPEIALARLQKEQAEVNLERTIIRASVGGVVANRQVEVGQRVAQGTPLMSIVPVTNMYVNANFKENQLKTVKVGQSVELVSDLYGNSFKFHGVVAGVSGGTGASFSLIPPQNASGNWIKVVQRLPVRINLRQDELVSHPLRVGLSMKVKINTYNEAK